ncbi:MAG: hypothetical protein ACFFED_08980 [Candidatus Thorarchaeota archaeon]
MIEDRTLDELPNTVFVALGRRGMESIPLKECTYDCDGNELTLLDVSSNPAEITRNGTEEVTENWKVKCEKCRKDFTISCRIRYHDGERMDTMVSLFDDKGKNLGWLGSY